MPPRLVVWVVRAHAHAHAHARAHMTMQHPQPPFFVFSPSFSSGTLCAAGDWGSIDGWNICGVFCGLGLAIGLVAPALSEILGMVE